jgi:hypothetical protein
MSRKQVAVALGGGTFYLLRDVKRSPEGKALSGHVVNGEWGPLDLTKQKVLWQIDIPDTVHGDYNEILHWAKTKMEDPANPNVPHF